MFTDTLMNWMFWKLIIIVNSQVSKKFTPQVSSWFSTTKGIDCEEITRDWADQTVSGHSSYHQTFDFRWKRVFPVTISGLLHFLYFTSGLSGYHQKVGNKILEGVPWKIFGILPRLVPCKYKLRVHWFYRTSLKLDC